VIGRTIAYLRGYLPSRTVTRLGRQGSDAYDLVDTLPPGPARVAAWNAYVCQTYADKLCGADPVAPETAPVVRALYDQAGTWLERARTGSADGELALPRWRTPVRSQGELAGMRDTLEALRTHVAFDLGASADDARLTAIDRRIATVDSMWIPRATPDLRLGIGDALIRGIAEACALGRALARGSS
jgi:hypothetical protein